MQYVHALRRILLHQFTNTKPSVFDAALQPFGCNISVGERPQWLGQLMPTIIGPDVHFHRHASTLITKSPKQNHTTVSLQ